MTLDYSKITNIEFKNINHRDYPDYCDAYIASADYDGVEMTEEQLQILNEDSMFVYDTLIEHIF